MVKIFSFLMTFVNAPLKPPYACLVCKLEIPRFSSMTEFAGLTVVFAPSEVTEGG